MQKAIAKYGLAAHLALLAVAPLFLFPFFGETTIATVLLWLSLPAAVWTLLQPSVRHGEMMHDARMRSAREILLDPLFWVMAAIVIATGIRALNTGVEMTYDAENSLWQLSSASMPLFPASCGSRGFAPFSTALAFLVIATACRHSLGRAARHGFLLMSSAFAGTAAVTALYQGNIGNPLIVSALSCPMRDMSFIGLAFAVHFMSATAALAASVENRWNRALPVSILSVGGTAAGALAFMPVHDICIFVPAAAAVFFYTFFHCMFSVKSSAEFKFMMFAAVCLGCGWLFQAATIPGDVLGSRFSTVLDGEFFREGYLEARKTLSSIAVKSWVDKPWTGTGVGSFALDIRFNAAPADWASIPRGIEVSPFGLMTLIAERGIVGAATFVLPILFLAFTYVRRLVTWAFTRTMPPPACLAGPVATAAVVASSFFDCSFMRSDVILAAGGLFALSASSFPKAGGRG